MLNDYLLRRVRTIFFLTRTRFVTLSLKYPEAKVAATASDIWAHVEVKKHREKYNFVSIVRQDKDVDIPEALIASVLAVYGPSINVEGELAWIVLDTRRFLHTLSRCSNFRRKRRL